MTGCGGPELVRVGTFFSYPIQLCDSRIHSCRPQRERLPCFKLGILLIGKIKPTIAIRAEVRLIFSEIESTECSSIFSLVP